MVAVADATLPMKPRRSLVAHNEEELRATIGDAGVNAVDDGRKMASTHAAAEVREGAMVDIIG